MLSKLGINAVTRAANSSLLGTALISSFSTSTAKQIQIIDNQEQLDRLRKNNPNAPYAWRRDLIPDSAFALQQSWAREKRAESAAKEAAKKLADNNNDAFTPTPTKELHKQIEYIATAEDAAKLAAIEAKKDADAISAEVNLERNGAPYSTGSAARDNKGLFSSRNTQSAKFSTYTHKRSENKLSENLYEDHTLVGIAGVIPAAKKPTAADIAARDEHNTIDHSKAVDKSENSKNTNNPKSHVRNLQNQEEKIVSGANQFNIF